MNRPLFSVIVPIYKVENYLLECIESILGQTYKNFELILVDDGSPDNCPAICDRYNNNENIVVIHKENGGLVSARNAGLSIAQGSYICFVDGDDYVEKNLLERLSQEIISSNYAVDIISFNYFFDKNKEYHDILPPGKYNKEQLISDVYPYMLFDRRKNFYTFGISPNVWSKAIRKEVILKSFCRDERITQGEDTAVTYLSFLNSNSVILIADCLYHYRTNQFSMLHKFDQNRCEKICILKNYLDEYYKKYDVMNEQLTAFYCTMFMTTIYNIARNSGIITTSRLMNEQINTYKFDKLIDNYNYKSSLAKKIFFLMARKKYYFLLTVGCKFLQIINYT